MGLLAVVDGGRAVDDAGGVPDAARSRRQRQRDAHEAAVGERRRHGSSGQRGVSDACRTDRERARRLVQIGDDAAQGVLRHRASALDARCDVVAAGGVETGVDLDDVADRERGLAASQDSVEHGRGGDVDGLAEHDQTARRNVACADGADDLAREDDAAGDARAVAGSVDSDRRAAHVGAHAEAQIVTAAHVAVAIADCGAAIVEMDAVDDDRAEAGDGAAGEGQRRRAGAAAVDATATRHQQARGEAECGSQDEAKAAVGR